MKGGFKGFPLLRAGVTSSVVSDDTCHTTEIVKPAGGWKFISRLEKSSLSCFKHNMVTFTLRNEDVL